MTIKWFGHSCFLLESQNGTKILMDPCDPPTGYNLQNIECGCITASHAHHDHNYIKAAVGEPTIINTPGEHTFDDVKITGIKTYHDEVFGAKRGENIVFVFETEGMRIAHMGDIGALPDEGAIKAIGTVDVMLLPVGGTFTVDAQGAVEIEKAINPRVIIPMHYKTPALSFELDGLDKFISAMRTDSIHYIRDCEVHLDKNSLGNDRVIVLEYAK